MAKRKPVPRVNGPNNDSQASRNEPADPRITRYSLSDAPLLPAAEQDIATSAPYDNAGAYDNISSAVDQLLQSYPDHLHPNYGGPRPVSGAYEPVSTSDPAYDRQEPQSVAEYRPYQPGQYLAPILTGETLQLSPQIAQNPIQNPTPDPFNDPQTPIAQTPQTYFYDQDYVPPSDYAHSGYETAYESQETLPAGAELDHFRHDTEAYASGNYSRASFRPPRSRSPTPAVDEEDYYVVGNESLHYTGRPDDLSYSGDPEKAALHEQYGQYESRYLGSATNIVYDPEPETPTSVQYSLPETPLETRHFGPAPTGRVLRRNKTRKRVQLTNGNLVIELPVPPKLVLPRRGEPDVMTTRYTAVTCDPDDFAKGFGLRQYLSGRRTELFIVITMYNVRVFSFIYVRII